MNELIQRRAAMMQSRSGGIDWETIARGMCDFTTSLEIPAEAGLDASKDYCCLGRANLISVVIASSITKIGISAFANCTALTSIVIPSGVTSLMNNCFSKCMALSSISLPNTLTLIQSYAFQQCDSLTSLTLPNSVNDLRAQCIVQCALTEIIVEATSPPTYGANAIYNNNHLASIYVPDASVSAYQAASGWSTHASIIKGISQRPT